MTEQHPIDIPLFTESPTMRDNGGPTTTIKPPEMDTEKAFNIQCEFCDKLAVWKNCWFYPATQEDSISGPFNLCQFHFTKMDDDEASTGDELLITPSELVSTQPHIHTND